MSSEAAIIAIEESAAGRPEAEESMTCIERARRGDVHAFEQLMRAHEESVVRTAWRLLGRREDARDAAQEVFLRLYRYLDRVDAGRDLAPWLYRVTVNVCHDLGRRRSRQPPTLDESATELVASAEPGPGDRAELAEEQRIAAAAIVTLPRKERAALVLRDVEGLSTREVAEILGTSQVTVRTHVCRARWKVKNYRDRMLGGSDEL